MGRHWQYTNEENKGTYCPFSEVVFTGLLLAMTWSFVGIAAAVMVFLQLPSWMNRAEERDLDEEEEKVEEKSWALPLALPSWSSSDCLLGSW